MRIRKADNVAIITGKDRGKTGKVTKVFPLLGKVVVEGVNLRKKHVRPRKQGQKGQIVQLPGLINISNVALICPACGQKTKISFKFKETGSVQNKKSRAKTRFCKKCQKKI